MSRRRAALLVACVIPCVARDGFAQSTASTEAAELFTQGRAALVKKDYATACPKLAESLRLERAVGTLISLADCEEATGKLAAARQHWKEAADFAEASNDALRRAPYARERLAKLDPRVPRLVVHVLDGAPADTTVRRDDIELGRPTLDTPLPLDPGPHRLVITAKDREAKAISLELVEGETKRVDVEPGAPVATPHPSPPRAAGADAEEPPASTSTPRVLGFVSGGVGVAGIALGAFFGIDAGSKWSRAKAECGGGCPAGSQARADMDDAKSAATLSTVAFAAGGVALAAGAVLLLIAPSHTRAAVSLRPRVGARVAEVALDAAW